MVGLGTSFVHFTHCYDLIVDGGVMVWGRCDYGQLGLDLGASEGVRCSHLPAELVPLRGAREVRRGMRCE